MTTFGEVQTVLSGRLIVSPSVISKEPDNSTGTLISGSAPFEGQQVSKGQDRELKGADSSAGAEIVRSRRSLWGRSGDTQQFMQKNNAFVEAQKSRQNEIMSHQQRNLLLAVEEDLHRKLQMFNIQDSCKIKLAVTSAPEVSCLKVESNRFLLRELGALRLPALTEFPSQRTWQLKDGNLMQVSE